MTALYGQKAEDFINWLKEARHFMPGTTTLYEAKLKWEQFIQENKNSDKGGHGEEGKK